MNKLVKGSIAGAAGIALLLGGAGSLALWSDSAALSPTTITAGNLDIAPVSAGSWSPALTKIVPGDSTTYTQNYTVVATGDNMHATLTTNAGTIANSITNSTVTTTFVVKDSSNVPVTPASGVYTLNAGSYTVAATVVVAFPSTTLNQVGTNGTITFTGLSVSLNQV
jgi:alternate signal-mediated exported protein